jgi:hypothetical protein
MLLKDKNAVIYGGGGAIGGAVDAHARTITASAINITCGAIIT